ncbi:MAG: PAS-domain containing protein [Rhodospirillum sp.]|nr:PAS-domain containing protein [Rhodospirillum sp.]
MIDSLDLPQGGPDEVVRLRKIAGALMKQVERAVDAQGGAYSLFQAAILLDAKVRERTGELEETLDQLERANRDLERAKGEALRAQGRLSDAVESISEGFALFDADDRLILFNERFWDFWGDHRHEIPYGTTFADVARRLHVEYEAPNGLGEAAVELWLTERLERHRGPKGSFVVQLRDGRWMKINERVTAEGGRVAIYTDITDIKLFETQRRERELAEKSVVLQSSLDSLSQGVAVFDGALRLVAWNERFLELMALPNSLVVLGMGYEDYLRYNARRGEYGPDGERAVALRLDRAKSRESLFFEYTRPNGRVIEIQRNPMPGGGFVTTYTDATARQESEAQLREAKESLEQRVRARTDELKVAKDAAEEANRSKTRFLAAASHDLLQPLNTARLYISMLMDHRLEPEIHAAVERTDFALGGVEALLGTLLEISKLDAGAVPVVPGDFALSDLLGRLEREYAPQAEERGLALRVMPCAGVVRSDIKLLSRVLRNLLSNALRYTERGRVLVGCRNRGDHLEVGVWDTGPGISGDDRERIFEEFRRLDNARIKSDRGVGLGLAIVRRVARMLDHRVAVRSIPGRGAAFTVLVPRGRKRVAPEPPKPALPQELEAITVAVVENEPEIRTAMGALLKTWGCRMVGGATAAEVLVRLRAEGGSPPRAIVADYHLDDGVTGLSAIAELTAALGPLPALVVTADGGDDVRRAVRLAGHDYLSKPVRVARLRAWLVQAGIG